jgi:conjugation system TraG family ATPase
MDFTRDIVSMNNFKVDDECIHMGDRKCKVFSLVDVDNVGLPALVRPYHHMEVNNTSMPVDLLTAIDSIPEAETVIYNQMIYVPGQKRELSQLDKKKNRHASMPSPSNQIAVEDIKRVQEVIAREGKQLVYTHYNLIVCCDRQVDMQKPTNHLENLFGRLGVHLSKRVYNQLELFVNSFPGNCYGMSADYDRFLTLSDAATCFMYKEHLTQSEDTPLRIHYTDRQGVPVAIDITGKEGAIKLTDNSNFFCLGPSGSGKSFHINSVMRQLHEQGTDVVMVDTGNSYEGLCEYLGGKYISYTEERPITMNPFHITREELNIEKINFLKNLILQIWKGSNGVVSKTEDRLIGQTIDEYYKAHFAGDIQVTLSFNSFFEYATVRVPQIIEENELKGIDVADLNYQLRDFYRGGSHETTLNENMDSSLFDETFIVFEIDAIKDDPTLFPIVTLIIMDVFLQKMRLKKNRKVLVIEEAWKAIATPLMAEYIKYLYKTARKFWASVGVVTQEIQDIIGSEIVKEAIINNSDVVMLLDQSKFRERFDNIRSILGLTEVDCKKIFTINRLDNKEGRSFFREVFIRRGAHSGVYGVEESPECYMTYTTERAEKDALKLYKAELQCSHQEAIERYCRDWERSRVASPLEFARRVHQAGRVLNLPEPNSNH